MITLTAIRDGLCRWVLGLVSWSHGILGSNLCKSLSLVHSAMVASCQGLC